MALDFNQNSTKIYLKITHQGTEHSFALPLPKKPLGWENMAPEELAKKEKTLKKLGEDIEDAILTILNESLSEEQFLAQMSLIFKRLTKVLVTTPINLYAVRWVCELCLRNKPTTLRVWHICNAMRNLLNSLGDERKKPLNSLKSHHLEKHIRWMRETNYYTPAMANNEVAVLRGFARVVDPTGTLGKHLEKEAVYYYSREPLTIPQLRKIMKSLKRQGAIGEEWRTVILIVLYTPIRPSAASTLKIDMINFKNGSITCYDKGKIVTVAPNKVLLEHLQRRCNKLRSEKRGPWLTQNLNHKDYRDRNRQFRDILLANDISMDRAKPKYGRKMRYEHCLYDLRHRFMNWVYGLTRSWDKTKTMTNHDSDEGMRPYPKDSDPFVLEQQRKLLDLAPKVI
jgi:integrase